jgi:hypothetical protein
VKFPPSSVSGATAGHIQFGDMWFKMTYFKNITVVQGRDIGFACTATTAVSPVESTQCSSTAVSVDSLTAITASYVQNEHHPASQRPTPAGGARAPTVHATD